MARLSLRRLEVARSAGACCHDFVLRMSVTESKTRTTKLHWIFQREREREAAINDSVFPENKSRYCKKIIISYNARVTVETPMYGNMLV